MLSAKLIAVLLLVGSLSPMGVYAEYYGAKGYLTCRNALYTDGFVAIWEKDRTDPDDFLAITGMDRNARFSLTGSHSEWTGTIDPYLVVYHRCGHEDLDPNCYWMEQLPLSDQGLVYKRERDLKFDDFDRIELYEYSENFKTVKSEKACDVEQINEKLGKGAHKPANIESKIMKFKEWLFGEVI